MGKPSDLQLLDKRNQHRYVGRNVDIPDEYEMHKSGLFLRKNVTAVKQVELLYGTPKNYLYYMNRPSDERWIEEQKGDNTFSAPITLDMIERGVLLTSNDNLLRNERGRSDYKRMSDIELCEEIDRIVVSHFKVPSIYCMSYSNKQELFSIYKMKPYLPKSAKIH